jgi:hypothetical protein
MKRAYRINFAPETVSSKRDNAIERKQMRSKINKPDPYPPAHNGLVAGSIRAKLTMWFESVGDDVLPAVSARCQRAGCTAS